MSHAEPGRRSFLFSLGAMGLGGRLVRPAREMPPELEPWLQGMNGTHKQILDVGRTNAGGPLRRTSNLLTSYASAYKLAERDVSVLFGAHGDGLPFVCGDRLWSRLKLGELYDIQDPRSHQPATANVFLTADGGATALGLPAEASVTSLGARGVRFLACNNSITSLAQRLASKGVGNAADNAAEIRAGLVPAAMVVPAMLIACNRAQEAGFTYASLA